LQFASFGLKSINKQNRKNKKMAKTRRARDIALLISGSLAGSILSFFGTSLYYADRLAHAEEQRASEIPAIVREYTPDRNLEQEVIYETPQRN
jgi:hypothetical protein